MGLQEKGLAFRQKKASEMDMDLGPDAPWDQLVAEARRICEESESKPNLDSKKVAAAKEVVRFATAVGLLMGGLVRGSREEGLVQFMQPSTGDDYKSPPVFLHFALSNIIFLARMQNFCFYL